MREPVSTDFIARVTALLAERGVSEEQAPPRTPEPVPSRDSLHEAAAVLSWFDPQTLRPADGRAERISMDALLADALPTVDQSGTHRWTLAPEVRIATLRQLRERERVRQALEANHPRPDDQVQQALDGYLMGDSAKAVEEQSLRELAASQQVCEWLSSAGFQDLPDRKVFAQRLDWLTLLEPFEHLAGRHFRGRKHELQRLRAYAGVLPPGSIVESTRRIIENVLSLTEKPPLIIYGPGGVGKSTLVARFILEHASALEQDRFPFVYLDFDRPEISAQQPLSLLIEAVRQLGIEYAQARERCERVRQGWLELIKQEMKPVKTEAPQIRGVTGVDDTRSAVVRDFASLMNSLGAHDRPVVFVLDTFEVVQERSEEQVGAVWRLLEELQPAVPRLRVVVAGRANVPRLSTNELPLMGLDEESAIAYLQSRGITDLKVARRVARQIGGTPLSLQLAAELAEREGLDASGRLDIDTREYFFVRMDEALIQRQLYKRVLDHIRDPDTRKVAHPGLVLRRLTPELILEVLAEPCDLRISSLYGAKRVFNELKSKVSIVREASDGALQHRPDLRRLMLGLLHADEPQKTRAIHTLAVEYYERRHSTPQERAEEIYHRLSLNQEPSVIDARWLEGVEPHLDDALPEFSGTRRAYLASRLGLEVDEETRRLADLEDWEHLVERKVRDLLAQEKPEEALDELTVRTERTQRSPLVSLQATALARLERWAESLAVLEEGIERALADGEWQRTMMLTFQAAEVVIASGDHSAAPLIFSRLEWLAEGSPSSPSDRLDIIAHRLALARLDPSKAPEVSALLERELRERFDALPDDALIERPTLARWTASVFSPQDVGRLSRVLRIVGLPRQNDRVLRHLAAEITAFDGSVSEEAGQDAGSLARELGIPMHNSLIVTWTDFLLTANDGQVREILCRLLDEHSNFVQPRLVGAFATVMRSALGIERGDDDQSARSSLVQQRKQPDSVSDVIRAELVDAMREAFPSIDVLREFLRYRLDRNLDAITPTQDLATAVRHLVQRADAEGWLVLLVAKAYESRPDNILLTRVADQLGLSTLGKRVESPLEPIRRRGSFLDPGMWRQQLSHIESQVCRLEVAGRFFGTGFLVGVDLLLTADHLVKAVYDRDVLPSDVRLRFDYKSDQGGHSITPGTLFELEHDWLVAHSEFGEGPKQLGYALLRVRNSPGAQPIGGGMVEPSAALRRWIEMRDPPRIGLGDGLTMIHYPEGALLQLTFNSASVYALDNDVRVYYDLVARPGSAGAPCFTLNFDLVALHIARSEAIRTAPRGMNVGVLVAAVLRDLRDRGLDGLLSVPFD